MNKDSFDAVSFVAWFENVIDFILGLIEKLKSKLTTTTTTVVADEPAAE